MESWRSRRAGRASAGTSILPTGKPRSYVFNRTPFSSLTRAMAIGRLSRILCSAAPSVQVWIEASLCFKRAVHKVRSGPAHINTRYSSSILPRNAFAWTSDSASIRHSTLQFSSVRMAICAPALESLAALV